MNSNFQHIKRQLTLYEQIAFYIKHNADYSIILNALFFSSDHPLITSNGVSEWKIIFRAILGLNKRANIFLL